MILIVQSEWNSSITDQLLEGAERVLKQASLEYVVEKVPGALEIPLAVKWAAESRSKQITGAIALGCVIKGETYHFDLVANESARKIIDLSTELSLPIMNGILTVYDLAQARDRIGGKHGHKGEEVAQALLTMLKLRKRLT